MIRSGLSILALVLLSLASLGRSTALAAVTQDQSYTGSPDLFSDVDSSFSVKQTYAAGLTGSMDHVTVYLTNVDLTGATPNLQVQILNAKDAVLGTTTINPAGLPNWNAGGGCAAVDVYVAAPQTAGRQYAIALSSNSSLTYGWCGTQGSGYSAGSVYQSAPPGSRWRKSRAAGDLFFTTYVNS